VAGAQGVVTVFAKFVVLRRVVTSTGVAPM
jgi:hypothetical protein